MQNQFIRIFAAFGLALFGVTWKLWTPQTVFPQIPFFEFLVNVPGWVDWILFGLIALSLLILLANLSKQSVRVGCLVFCAALIFSVSLNQHRFQPWAYHFLIFAALFGLSHPAKLRRPLTNQAPSSLAIQLMRWVVISIYTYSALSKFDYQFAHTIGTQMLETLVGFAGVESKNWSPEMTTGLVLLFPLGELLVGILLAISKSRKFRFCAIAAAILLHLTLLLLLGPLGLNHQPGVLIWNLFFIVQVIWLFGGSGVSNSTEPESLQPANDVTKPPTAQNDSRMGVWLSSLLVAFVLIFPITQLIGICDHWPAWQVYSPCSSRVKLVGTVGTVGAVGPGDVQRSLSDWSLDKLGVPIYPQARFQLGVAKAIVEKKKMERGFQIELGSQSNRLTGERTTKTLSSAEQIQMAQSQYWLNTKARSIWFEE